VPIFQCFYNVSAAVPVFETLCAENSEADCLGTQLKERLLRLEEEKNNIRNMEKQIKAEKVSSKFSTKLN
jgi:uncharacterized protein (UPF0335 family)